MELESHVLSTGSPSSGELVKRRKMQQPALSKSSEQKIPSSKQILSNLTFRDGARATPGFPGCL